MTTNNLEHLDKTQATATDGGALSLANEVYSNSAETLKAQRQMMQKSDANGAVSANFGDVVLFDSAAPSGDRLNVTDGGAQAETKAESKGREIKRDAQGRPTEVDGTKFHYGPDGQIDRVEYPKGWNYDGGDTYVKGNDGKWRDTKHGNVRDDFRVKVDNDGTTTITETWGTGTHTNIKRPDGTSTQIQKDNRNYTEQTDFDKTGLATHTKVWNPKGELVYDKPASHGAKPVKN